MSIMEWVCTPGQMDLATLVNLSITGEVMKTGWNIPNDDNYMSIFLPEWKEKVNLPTLQAEFGLVCSMERQPLV